MANQVDLDRAYLDIALRWAGMSKAARRKVGCIIVKDNQIISDGFNGTPAGFDNNCEDIFYAYDERDFYGDSSWSKTPDGSKFYKFITKPEVLHAESNALMKLARSTNSSVGSTMYLTCNPCFDCAKLIIQAGISRVVYKDDYRNNYGVVLLRKANIIIEKL